jgi:hypothetical protein
MVTNRDLLQGAWIEGALLSVSEVGPSHEGLPALRIELTERPVVREGAECAGYPLEAVRAGKVALSTLSAATFILLAGRPVLAECLTPGAEKLTLLGDYCEEYPRETHEKTLAQALLALYTPPGEEGELLAASPSSMGWVRNFQYATARDHSPLANRLARAEAWRRARWDSIEPFCNMTSRIVLTEEGEIRNIDYLMGVGLFHDRARQRCALIRGFNWAPPASVDHQYLHCEHSERAWRIAFPTLTELMHTDCAQSFELERALAALWEPDALSDARGARPRLQAAPTLAARWA